MISNINSNSPPKHTYFNCQISKFCSNLKTLWREVDAYGEVPHCDCTTCTCNVNGSINDREDRLKIKKKLMDLSDDFRQIRLHILSMDKLPNFGKVFSIVTYDEAQQHLTGNANTMQGSAFYSTKGKSHFHAGKPSNAPSSSNTNTNQRKRPPTPTDSLYYESGKQVNTRYYCFHFAAFGHSQTHFSRPVG